MPARSRRPRQSSSGASPATPIATSTCPWRHARPNESAITTAGRCGSADAQLARRRRRGRAAAARRSPSGALDASTPALAHTNPCVRAADQHAGRRAHDLRRLVEHRLDLTRVGQPVALGQVDGPWRWLDRRQRPRRGPAPWRPPCARRRARRRRAVASAAREQRCEVGARRDLGQAARAPGSSITGASACRACGRRRRSSRRAPSAARRGPRACRCRAPATAPARPRPQRPAASASATWRSQLSGPNDGAITSGGVSSSALVPVPWRSGTTTTPDSPSPAADAACRHRPARASGSHRPPAGPLGAAAACLGDADERGVAVRVVLEIFDDLGVPRDGEALGIAVTRHDDHRLDRLGAAQRHQHVGQHRLDQCSARDLEAVVASGAAWPARTA